MGKKFITSVLGVLISLQSCYSSDFDDDTDYTIIYEKDSVLATNLPVVPQKAFYKDLFLDAGIGLTSRKFLYAARYLGLATEGISFSRSNASEEEITLQNNIIAGDEHDTNGRLLYPDGQPRYRLLFVNGGSSTTHGKSLSENAFQNMRQFVKNGGCYVGTCAGAFFASNGYDANTDYPYYLSLWPGTMSHTGISNETTGMFIEQDSPLFDYYDFGGDCYVADVRHNKGGYPAYLPEGTKVLARYDYPEKDDVHLQPCIWTYKQDEASGRIVQEGSHPEEVSSGERRDLTAAMMLYAMDGVGKTTAKGVLHNGEVRVMDKTTEDNAPQFARIGDLQCHHFITMIPENANDVTLEVSSDADCDLSLMLCRNTFAYPEDADYVSSEKGSHQQLTFSRLDAGLWFVTVKCLTTIEVTETEYGQSYLDKYNVLNGVPYRISVSWNNSNTSIPHVVNEKKESANITWIDGKIHTRNERQQIYIHEGKKIINR